MKKIYSRALSMLTALAMVCTVFVTTPGSAKAATGSEPLKKVEAEACTLASGISVAKDVYGTEYPGYTGDGFAWVTNGGPITLKVDVPENGMYELKTRCWMYLGAQDETRLQSVNVNGKKIGDFYIPNKGQWIDYSFGFFYLEKGTATLEVGASGSWGYILYDSFTFDYADMPKLDIDATPSDLKATSETKALKEYLTSVYGKSVISGQQEIYGSGHDGNYEYEFDYIKDKTGKLPAIRGFDYMNFNPLYGWDDGTTERAIDWVNNKGGIATVCWHINVPQDFTSYTLGEAVDWQKCTYKPTSSFNTANCLDKSTKEYAYFMAAVDDLAEQLLRLQDAKVPVIFRPFHEAEGYNNIDGKGAWFWWGSSGAEAYKGLWKLLYTTLTEKYGLHNLIWEVNLYTYANSFQWYPGDNYVDIVAYDKYEGSPANWGTSAATSLFLTLVNYTNDTKMVAMSENDIIPDIKNIQNEGAWWLYFCPWYSEYLTDKNDPTLLNTIYNSDKVITLDELPEDLYNSAVQPQRLIGDVNLDGNVDAIDFGLIKSYLLGISTASIDETNADLDGSGSIDALDFAYMKQKLLGLIDKFPVEK